MAYVDGVEVAAYCDYVGCGGGGGGGGGGHLCAGGGRVLNMGRYGCPSSYCYDQVWGGTARLGICTNILYPTPNPTLIAHV